MGQIFGREQFPQRYLRLEDKVRRLRDQDAGGLGGPFSFTKTFVVGGEVSNAIYIPPMIVMPEMDGIPVETHTLFGADHFCRTGSVTIQWKHTPFSTGVEVTFFPNAIETVLHTWDRIRPHISSGSGMDLSAAVRIVVQPGVAST
jgi:hypothetical protein